MSAHLRSERLRWPAVAIAVACCALLTVGVRPTVAHVSPAGCSGNALLLAVSRDSEVAYTVGSTIAYVVTVAVPAPMGAWQPCEVTNISATFTRPDGQSVTLPTIASLGAGQSVVFTGDTIPALNYVIPSGEVASTTSGLVASVVAAGTAHTGPQDGAVEANHSLSTELAPSITGLLGAGRWTTQFPSNAALRVRLDRALPSARPAASAPVTLAALPHSRILQPLNLHRWIGGPLPDRRDGRSGS